MSMDMDIKNLISLFDQDGDGHVSPEEFMQILQTFDLKLTKPQLQALVRAVGWANSHESAKLEEDFKIDAHEFLARFVVIYKTSANLGRRTSEETSYIIKTPIPRDRSDLLIRCVV